MSIETQSILAAVQKYSFGAAISISAVTGIFAVLVLSLAFGIDLIGW